MVQDLLTDLRSCPEVSHILLTLNIPETCKHRFSDNVRVRTNNRPLGYGANHNQAFQVCRTPFVCVMNPDIRINKNPFPALLQTMEDKYAGVCAPKIIGTDGTEEDSHRLFPSLSALLAKALWGKDGSVMKAQARKLERNSWLAGMFLLLRSEAFRKTGGFDKRFFLYYEDVDLCARLIRAGYHVRKVPSVNVIHNAQRKSRRNPLYASWHLQSMARFLWKQLTGLYHPLQSRHRKETIRR